MTIHARKIRRLTMRERRMMRSKNKAEKNHFNRRCFERFGKNFSQRQLLNLLHGGALEFVEKQSNRITLWRKDDAVFVYDKSRKTFVTALTYEMWKNGRTGFQW